MVTEVIMQNKKNVIKDDNAIIMQKLNQNIQEEIYHMIDIHW